MGNRKFLKLKCCLRSVYTIFTFLELCEIFLCPDMNSSSSVQQNPKIYKILCDASCTTHLEQGEIFQLPLFEDVNYSEKTSNDSFSKFQVICWSYKNSIQCFFAQRHILSRVGQVDVAENPLEILYSSVVSNKPFA